MKDFENKDLNNQDITPQNDLDNVFANTSDNDITKSDATLSKADAFEERKETEELTSPQEEEKEHISLDDTQRIKVLSPGMLVLKRFIRSKLAVAGTIILVFMFAFSFLGAWISPYGLKEVFYEDKPIIFEYAMATERTEYNNYYIGSYTSADVPLKVRNMMNSNINSMIQAGINTKDVSDGDKHFTITKLGNNVYSLTEKADATKIYLISSTLVFDLYDTTQTLDNGFKTQALYALYTTKSFSYAGSNYTIKTTDDVETIYKVTGASESPFAIVSTFVVRRYTGEDTLTIGFKTAVEATISDMKANNISKKTVVISAQKIVFLAPVLDDEGNPVLDKNGNPTYREPLPLTDEDGNVIKEQIKDENGNVTEGNVIYEDSVARYAYDEDGNAIMEDIEFEIERKQDKYVLKNEQIKTLIDIYGKPSTQHWLGTDNNGMDVLTRIMYGGRISLMVGFVVIIIELLIGVILGGIAGYFGKWLDNIIMRLVDIFNCIPSLPIMIILGSMFDGLQMDPYDRLMWLMVVLGILGWPGTARLVRGQILSLREQEFMIAAEATGLSARRRIFRHLVPNVMPQLIVTATMGLGGIIITESTLSFLGLGAKFPLATWGYIINSVSSAAAMVSYTYIWIPVGLLICLTVIAFNFVGDGLRDAFDPKMKR